MKESLVSEVQRTDGTSRGLAVRGLTVAYERHDGSLNTVVSHVDVELTPGEIVGLAGESGCGKSTMALAALGFPAKGMHVLAGSSELDGVDLLQRPLPQLRRIWGKRVCYVSQDASRSLNPAIPIGRQLAQPLKVHMGLSGPELRSTQLSLLSAVGIPDPERALRRYAFQFSGGQQQRLALAIAFACRPEVLVLDEPTTGLDATTQVRVSALLRQLLRETGAATLYVSHDLSVLANTADRLVVMYGGEVVESGPVGQVVGSPTHPYTRALLHAVPTLRGSRAIKGIPGRPPLSVSLDRCAFVPRCEFATVECLSPVPLRQMESGHAVRCIRAQEVLQVSDSVADTPARAVGDSLLEVDALVVSYAKAPHAAVRGASFTVRSGETVGIVGESGSGKSTLLRTIAGLHPQESGAMTLRGDLLVSQVSRRSRSMRHNIQMVFQNPDSSLNPRHTVSQIIRRQLQSLRPDVSSREVPSEILALLEAVGLPSGVLHKFPSQLSGGQKQRVAIARAFAARPALLLCDEVTSALDVSVQATILELIDRLATEFGTSVIFVSHDLPVVRAVAQRVLVFKDGIIREAGATEQVLENPKDPYTRELIASLPDLKVPNAV